MNDKYTTLLAYYRKINTCRTL